MYISYYSGSDFCLQQFLEYRENRLQTTIVQHFPLQPEFALNYRKKYPNLSAIEILTKPYDIDFFDTDMEWLCSVRTCTRHIPGARVKEFLNKYPAYNGWFKKELKPAVVEGFFFAIKIASDDFNMEVTGNESLGEYKWVLEEFQNLTDDGGLFPLADFNPFVAHGDISLAEPNISLTMEQLNRIVEKFRINKPPSQRGEA